MKLFAHKIFTHRRIIYIFFLAIFLPLLIAGYLSLSTFPKRREAVKKLLESNLWISGEAAVNSIETALLKYEQEVLNTDNFSSKIGSGKADQSGSKQEFSDDSTGRLFLTDADLNVVLPEIPKENQSGLQFETFSPRLAEQFRQAENYEFKQMNYRQAAEIYKKAASSVLPEQLKAIALERLGRCLLSDRKFEEAGQVYEELYEGFGQILNNAGHPYGIVALFQLYEIAMKQNEEERSLKIVLNLYEQIRQGNWIIDQAVCDFYSTEIESILNNAIKEGKFHVIQRTYENLQAHPSPYKKNLLFGDFLVRTAIPVMKDKISLLRDNNVDPRERFLVSSENEYFLISYAALPDFQSGQTYYGGYCWYPESLKKGMIAGVLTDLSKESGLNFKIIDENEPIVTDKGDLTKGDFRVLSFQMFPLPWKLLVSHPEIKAIEKSAGREILFYGIVLVIILVLMLLGAVMIARDITRESEITGLKTEFVNNISHELKTPLTLIRLYGETLQRNENLTRAELSECYEIITKESERLSHLINNVLDFSRIETGRKEFEFRRGFLQDIIHDTLDSYRYHLEKKGFTIISEISEDLPEMIFDGEAIASLLINLLSNAMKFSPKEKAVTVKLYIDKDNAVLQVADKGMGISQEEISKIFQRFYRSKNRSASDARGSGLGLTLVKHITEAHNGRIEVVSEPGKGSVFSVILPVINPQNDQIK